MEHEDCVPADGRSPHGACATSRAQSVCVAVSSEPPCSRAPSRSPGSLDRRRTEPVCDRSPSRGRSPIDRCLTCVALLCVGSLPAAPLAAQRPSVVVVADPAVPEPCRAAFLGLATQLELLVDPEATPPAAGIEVDVHLAIASAAVFRAAIAIRVGRRAIGERVVEDARCDALLRTAALVTALALDAVDPGGLAPAAEPEPERPAPQSSSAWELSALVGAGVLWGGASGVAPVARLSVQAAYEWTGLHLEVAHAFETATPAAGGAIATSTSWASLDWTALIRLAPVSWSFHLGGAWLLGVGRGLGFATVGAAVWSTAAIHLGTQVSVAILGPIAIELGLAVQIPLEGARFEVSDGTRAIGGAATEPLLLVSTLGARWAPPGPRDGSAESR